jgi:hypothetical protein
MTPWIVGIVAALGVLLFLWWLWSQPHPEEKRPEGSLERLRPEGSRVDPEAVTYPPGSSRAGPGAESQRPDGRPSGGDGYPLREPPQS